MRLAAVYAISCIVWSSTLCAQLSPGQSQQPPTFFRKDFAFRFQSGAGGWDGPSQPLVGDFNGDGRLDLVSCIAGAVSVSVNTGNGNLGLPLSHEAPCPQVSQDFN